MILLWLLPAVAQVVFLLLLARAGRGLAVKEALDRAADSAVPEDRWPGVGLVIPVAGAHPRMADALKSLLGQDYPCLLPVLVTATDKEPAAALIRDLQKNFPAARHVVSGQAQGCGQKNHNSLSGVAALGEEADVLVFCDSTHLARPDFLRSLVGPIARGEAEFCTGYHLVRPRDARPVTLAYALCVLLMRLLQALAPFTQPWGGAMAMSRAAFMRCSVAELWARNVVDDCSLAGVLPACGARVRLCPCALLATETIAYPLPVWRAWMNRQVLFLKFCVPEQWLLLGLMALCMLLPLCCTVAALFAALLHLMPEAAVPALLHLAALTGILYVWRGFLLTPVPILPWLWAFVYAVCMFAYVYAAGLTAKGIVWHGIDYTVGRGGTVLATRHGQQQGPPV
ncbi:MAG: glycosyltransferase [Desulfovibrio sp.]|jgi:cellulose synthase/poly-beta-1,6-N-acetylglucosamine synthase-like glycosyltransferase|nr:glycosyltransferase [Desulfovibrio sp.]